MKTVLVILLLVLPIPALAELLQVQQVTDRIWAIVGPADQRNSENLGNNATFGLVETSDGAVLVDPGGSWKGAAMIHETIRQITDQPVRYVINTGGQDHRWLGNGYWQAEGAKIVASVDAVADQQSRESMQMTILSQLVGDALAGTEPATADITFEDAYSFELGGVTFDIHQPAAAHTPGDSFVWLPDNKIVFAGDIVYIGRILGVMEYSNSAEWLSAFEAVEALDPVHLIPGHGPPTSLAEARADTYDYLVNLRARIEEHIDAGGDIIGSVEVDQSDFARLDLFDSLAKRNAQTVFEQMEWE